MISNNLLGGLNFCLLRYQSKSHYLRLGSFYYTAHIANSDILEVLCTIVKNEV